MAADKKPQPHTRPVQTGPGKTDVAESAPRLPHEHDESADSQRSEEPRPEMRKAHDDVAAGRVDTDRGTPSNEAYQKQKGPEKPHG